MKELWNWRDFLRWDQGRSTSIKCIIILDLMHPVVIEKYFTLTLKHRLDMCSRNLYRRNNFWNYDWRWWVFDRLMEFWRILEIDMILSLIFTSDQYYVKEGVWWFNGQPLFYVLMGGCKFSLYSLKLVKNR